MINVEFWLSITDYIHTLRFRDVAWDFIIPLLLSVLSGSTFFCLNPTLEAVQPFAGVLVNFGSILVGFSLACFTIFATSSNPNIEEIRSLTTENKSRGRRMTLYQETLSGFMFIVLLSVLGLIVSLVGLMGATLGCGRIFYSIWLAGITLFIFFSIGFIIVRNMTNFYHILWKKPSTSHKTQG